MSVRKHHLYRGAVRRPEPGAGEAVSGTGRKRAAILHARLDRFTTDVLRFHDAVREPYSDYLRQNKGWIW